MKPYEEALDLIWDKINVTPPMHHSDFARIVDLFNHMLAAGKRVDHVDDMGNYLIDKGMGAGMARDIQHTYEVLDVLHHKLKSPWWNEDVYKKLTS
jgi:hypothetical protein